MQELQAEEQTVQSEVNTMTLKEQLAQMKAQQAELETQLAEMRKAATALAEARNAAVTKGLDTLKDAVTLALTEVEFPDNDVYPLVITIRPDGIQLTVAQGPTAQGAKHGRGVKYQGVAYSSAQALVNHLLNVGVIAKVPTSNYSAVRLLQSKRIAFTPVE